MKNKHPEAPRGPPGPDSGAWAHVPGSLSGGAPTVLVGGLGDWGTISLPPPTVSF